VLLNDKRALPLWQQLSRRGLGRAAKLAFSAVLVEAGHKTILAELFGAVVAAVREEAPGRHLPNGEVLALKLT
jgi:hypothetical protein